MVEEEIKCGEEDVCFIDTEALKKEKTPSEREEKDENSLLIFITLGGYGHIDDVFGAFSVGNAALAKQQNSTLILLDDGVFCAVKGQNPQDIGFPNNTEMINDFLELGGRIFVLKSSLEKRGIESEKLIEGIKILESSEVVQEIERHKVSLTF